MFKGILLSFAVVSGMSYGLACTDFSGDYTGACTIDGKRAEHTFTIEQKDCDMLKCHGKEFTVGSIMSVAASVPATASAEAYGIGKTAVVTWSEDKKDLLISAGFLKQPLKAVATPEKFVALTGKAASLDGNKLLVTLAKDGSTAAYGDCEFIKK